MPAAPHVRRGGDLVGGRDHAPDDVPAATAARAGVAADAGCRAGGRGGHHRPPRGSGLAALDRGDLPAHRGELGRGAVALAQLLLLAVEQRGADRVGPVAILVGLTRELAVGRAQVRQVARHALDLDPRVARVAEHRRVAPRDPAQELEALDQVREPVGVEHHGGERRLAVHVVVAQVLGQRLLGLDLLLLQPGEPHPRGDELVLRLVELRAPLLRAGVEHRQAPLGVPEPFPRRRDPPLLGLDRGLEPRGGAAQALLGVRGRAAAEHQDEYRQRQQETTDPHSRRRP